MTTDVHNLYETLSVGPAALKNRLAVAPMTRVSAGQDGTVDDRVVRYYGRWVRGGFGLLITEGVYTDTEYSQGYLFQPGMATAEQAASWQPLLREAHESGARVFAQLMHAGAQSQGGTRDGVTLGPSAIAPRGEQLAMYRGRGGYRVPRAATAGELRAVRQGFVNSARRAASAGFDGVEVHGANGYLLDEFLTDYLNDRTDPYGGSLENRLRLVREVCQEVVDAVGSQIAVGVRISQGKVSDNHHKWAGAEEEAAEIFTALATTGIHFLHTTEYRAATPLNGSQGKTMVELAKEFGKVPVIANGGLENLQAATSLVGAGQADVVAIGKAALADPDWPVTARNGGDTELPLPDGLLGPLADIKDFELEWASSEASTTSAR